MYLIHSKRIPIDLGKFSYSIIDVLNSLHDLSASGMYRMREFYITTVRFCAQNLEIL